MTEERYSPSPYKSVALSERWLASIRAVVPNVDVLEYHDLEIDWRDDRLARGERSPTTATSTYQPSKYSVLDQMVESSKNACLPEPADSTDGHEHEHERQGSSG